VPQALRVAKKPLESGARILAPEAVEVEVPLHRKITAFEAREIPPALPARGAFDTLAGGERIELAPAGDEVGKGGQSFGLVVRSLGELNGDGKAEGLLAPAERPNAFHLDLEGLLVREARRETRWRRRSSRGRERVPVEKLFQDLERSMARPERLGHGLYSATARSGNQCPHAGFDLVRTPR
jgi:hypothetical protein